MIKGRGVTNEGKPLLLLGLTRINIERLQDDQPIFISAEDMAKLGFPEMAVAIIAGETEASLSVDLGGMPLQPEVPGQQFHQRRKGTAG